MIIIAKRENYIHLHMLETIDIH